MLRPETRLALDAYWSGVFGVQANQLRPAAPIAVPRRAGDSVSSVYAMEFGGAPVAQVPREWRPERAGLVADALAAGITDNPAVWSDVLGSAVEAVIGPAALHYADTGTFRPLPDAAAVRLLDEGDLPAAEALRCAFAPAEWEHGGSAVGKDVTAGSFVGGELAALAGYEVWDERIAHISVIVHPAHRRRGHAAAAVSRITAEALERGWMAQYRTLESNAPSLAIARRLGFQPYARSLAIRLRSA